MARTAGLLGNDQRITHAKLFKAAKKALGVTSRRIGFGPRSQWLWQLPRQNEVHPSNQSGDKNDGGRGNVALTIPTEWIEGVACLENRDPPSDIPRHRWRQFVDDCRTFLRSSENWGGRAAQLGWDAISLFGCAPKRPLDYSAKAGLLWAINGGRLIELHRDWAVIDVPVNKSQRIFYRRNIDPAKVTLPWFKFGSGNR
jgi:hypothetical protein